MKPDPWIKQRNIGILNQFNLLRHSGAGYKETIEILAREHHLGFSTIKNIIGNLSERRPR